MIHSIAGFLKPFCCCCFNRKSSSSETSPENRFTSPSPDSPAHELSPRNPKVPPNSPTRNENHFQAPPYGELSNDWVKV